jgi:ATP-binding cassette subfamily B (MDR/TAP) protein 1
MHTGERQVAKMRMAYLKSMLNQDISLFDTESSTGDVISSITSDIIVVQEALSEKVCQRHFMLCLILMSALGPTLCWAGPAFSLIVLELLICYCLFVQ